MNAITLLEKTAAEYGKWAIAWADASSLLDPFLQSDLVALNVNDAKQNARVAAHLGIAAILLRDLSSSTGGFDFVLNAT